MKRLIALLLALLMCASLCACSAEKEMKNDIVGEWIAVSNGQTAVFNDDGTGEVASRSVTWKYDPNLDSYTIADTVNYNAVVGTEYDMQYMTLLNTDFYRPDDYDKAFTLMLSKRLEKIVDLTAPMEKIRLNTVYPLADGVTIEFTEIVKEFDGDMLVARYTVINNSGEDITEPMTSKVQGMYYLVDSAASKLEGEETWFSSLEAGETLDNQIGICHFEDVQKTIDAYGMVIGAVYYEMNGKQYYFDLSEWYK